MQVVLGIPIDKVRVLVGDVGGGFGMKTGIYPEDVVLAWAARKFGLPLKWCAERIEEFLAATHGRDVISKAELALDGDGRVLALRIDSLANVGACATPAGVVIQLMIGPWVSTSIYDIGTIDIRIRAVLTNTAPTGAYRGAGRPEAIYIIERLMDAAARQTGIDPVELRRRNLIRPEQMPYSNAMDKTYDSGQFELVLDKATALASWQEFDARAADARRRGRLRGRGMAAFLEWTGADVFEERVTVTVEGRPTGRGPSRSFRRPQAMGQGLATTYAQVAVDVFGVPIETIRIVQGDTDRGTGFGSAGSRSLFVGGSAVKVGAERTVVAAQALAAKELEAATRRHRIPRRGVQHRRHRPRIGLFDLARRQPQHKIVLDSISTVADATWPNGCHICEVEIDPDTGAVSVVRYWSVNDVGRVVNPMIVIGQLEGGAAQGIGQALVRGIRLRPRVGAGAFGDLARLRASARGDDRAFRDDDGRIDALPQQRDGRQGRRRAGHDRRDAGGRQRGDRRAGAGRRRSESRSTADAADVRARLARARQPRRLGRCSTTRARCSCIVFTSSLSIA